GTAWTLLGAGPPSCSYSFVTWNGDAGQLLLFGCGTAAAPRTETWLFAETQWKQVSDGTHGGPSAPAPIAWWPDGHAVSPVAPDGRSFYFDGSSWQQRGSGPARFGNYLTAYDPGIGAVISYGGYQPGGADDLNTYVLDNGGDWQTVAQGPMQGQA